MPLFTAAFLFTVILLYLCYKYTAGFLLTVDIISVYAVVHMDIFPNSLKYYLYSISHSNMPICRLYPFTLGVGKWLYYMQFIVLIHCPILRTGILQLYKLGYF